LDELAIPNSHAQVGRKDRQESGVKVLRANGLPDTLHDGFRFDPEMQAKKTVESLTEIPLVGFR
jgi:hypothetical protein